MMILNSRFKTISSSSLFSCLESRSRNQDCLTKEMQDWIQDAGLDTESSEFKLSQERMLTKTHLYEMVCRSVRGREMSVKVN